MTDPRKQTVRTGYDRLAAPFLEWGARVEGDPRTRFVEEFAALLPVPGSVLDLGCGAGVPSTRRLAETFAVVGADISEVQVGLARRNVPGATFVRADVVDLEFAPASFDGVCALYSISHIPREEHSGVFARVRRWLRPGGVFLADPTRRRCTQRPSGRCEWLGASRCSSRATRLTSNLRLLAEPA